VVNGDISYGSIAVEHGARLLGMVVQNKAASQSANRAQAAFRTRKASPEAFARRSWRSGVQ
jgi:cytoskeletal protein CcmA (bactofilin family)